MIQIEPRQVKERWFWVATRSACGAVVTDGKGYIIGGCPYYMAVVRRSRKWHIDSFLGRLQKASRYFTYKELT
jgi:hypothetical protein